MAREQLRPTFEIQTPEGPSAAATRLRRVLAQQEDRIEARWAPDGTHVMIAPVRAQRHFWSAWLRVDVRPPKKGDETIVFGRFAPSPTLWTAYVLTMVALVGVGMISIVLVLALSMKEKDAWGWWWVQVGALVITAALFAGTVWAQGKSSHEMDEMHAMVERALSRDAGASEDAGTDQRPRKAG